MTGHDKCLSILEQTPAILGNLLSGMPEDDLQWRPSPERWSISMVLAHLADVEVKGFRSRFEAMAEEHEPFLASYDQGALIRSETRRNRPGGLVCVGTFDVRADAFHDLGHIRQIMGSFQSIYRINP